jgi:hypothetical protein
VQTQGWSEREAAKARESVEASIGLLSCAACHGPVTNGAAARCPECRALYHVPCWNDLTGCVTPGCRGHRRVPNRGPLTLVSEPVEVVRPVEVVAPPVGLEPSSPLDGAPVDAPPVAGGVLEIEVDVEPVRLPSPRVELLPEPERVDGAGARRRRRDWISTVAIALVALIAGITATLLLVHHGDAKAHDSGYSSGYKSGYRQGATSSFDSGFTKGNQAGWKAGYERGFLEGCHAAKGPDAACFNPIVPAAGDGGSTPTSPPPSGSSPPGSGTRPVSEHGGSVTRVT